MPGESVATVGVGDEANPCNRTLTEGDVLGVLRPFWPAAVVTDLRLYQRAMTHRSAGGRPAPAGASSAAVSSSTNERLEFLGDAVLGLVVAAYLHERYPLEHEGFLSSMRTKLVNGAMLATLAVVPALALHRWVVVSRQQEELQARRNPAVLEDALEAFLGALFSDAGFDAAATWLVGFLEAHVDFAALVAGRDGFKAQLSRHMHTAFNSTPHFSDLSVAGATDGTRHYTVGVRSGEGGALVGTGVGLTRRAAEDDAARRALAYYGMRPGGSTA
jgi:ribonuclease-3